MQKILIIEDSNLIRLNIKRVLEKNGFEDIVGINSADLIIDKPHLYLHNVDLIIMDIGLPGISGIEAAFWLKNNIDYSNIPVMFLSSKSDSATVMKALEAGGVDYIVKPFKETDFLKRVTNILSKPQNLTKDTFPTIDLEEAKIIISIEYSRSVRGKQPVSFALIRVDKNDLKQNVNNIRQSLRQIDQIFVFINEEILIVLPLTDDSGTQIVVDKIEDFFSKEKIKISEKRVFTFMADKDKSLDELINEMFNLK